MRNLVCIICPIGCTLDINDSGGLDKLKITGNKCPRGDVYAQEEVRAPKRVVTATCKINGETGSVRRLPVKTSSPCHKEKIPALLQDIYKVKVSLPIKAGDVIIAGWNGEDINVIATRTLN